ncbi:MAG TPA: GtrA family protein [Candidatus Limnocylindrales bacterium]|jgi:putative flippase GtrA
MTTSPSATTSLAALLRQPFGSESLGAQVRTFAAVGVLSTLAWVLLYAVFRTALGPVGANAAALVLSAIGNTAANRRLTFGIRGRSGLARDHGAGLAAFAIAFVLTTGAALALSVAAPHASRSTELLVLITANAAATASRFVLLRTWLGRGSRAG